MWGKLVMKFSVLIPTRNRLEYLKYAVLTVLEQNYSNWEIIISDNCSEEDVEGYVRSLKDPRILYFRTSNSCSVTENWNNAIEKSSGDYIVMLGDDDGLLSGYFLACISLLKEFDFPDLVYNSALIYSYPNVISSAPQGSLAKYVYSSFFVNKKDPFVLKRKEALKAVKKILGFTVEINFNAQHCLFKRDLRASLSKYGSFYQSPYPDYYSTTALFLKAKRILVVPYPLVIIGVCPKSFGFYYFNNQEEKGVCFLKNQPESMVCKQVEKVILEGANMNISWLISNETVRVNFIEECNLKVNYKKFRFLQIGKWIKRYAFSEGVRFFDMMKLIKKMTFCEKICYFPLFLLSYIVRKNPKFQFGKKLIAKMEYAFSHPSFGRPVFLKGQYSNILDVFKNVTIKDCKEQDLTN